MKQILISSLAAVSACTAASAAQFEDTLNHWSGEYVNILSERGIVAGMEDGMFHPEESVTTEQFVAMVIRSVKSEIAPSDNSWASGYIDYAKLNGIIEDYDVLNRSNPIERRAVARIVHETLVREYGEADESDWLGAKKLADLYDCHTCVGHIAQVYAKGIMTGREENLFDNYGTLTRAEAAAVIVRMTDKDKRTIPEIGTAQEVKQITPEEAFAITNAIIIDVRTAEEFSAGHIKSSVNIPLEDIIKNPYAISENRDNPIILYCVKGYKSTLAANELIGAGYTAVYTIPGVEQYDYELAITN